MMEPVNCAHTAHRQRSADSIRHAPSRSAGGLLLFYTVMQLVSTEHHAIDPDEITSMRVLAATGNYPRRLRVNTENDTHLMYWREGEAFLEGLEELEDGTIKLREGLRGVDKEVTDHD